MGDGGLEMLKVDEVNKAEMRDVRFANIKYPRGLKK
jgi:hypothetical protein